MAISQAGVHLLQGPSFWDPLAVSPATRLGEPNPGNLSGTKQVHNEAGYGGWGDGVLVPPEISEVWRWLLMVFM